MTTRPRSRPLARAERRPASANPPGARSPIRLALLSGCALLAGCAGGPSTGVATTADGAGLPLAPRAADADAGADLAVRLHLYLALLGPDATPDAIAGFLAANPVWPNRAWLAARYDALLARDPDDARAAALCRARPVTHAPALARCAAATGNAADARAAWRDGIDASSPAAARIFAALWGGAFTPTDSWARFLRLLDDGAAGRAAAAASVPSLGPDRAALARALLLFASGEAADPLRLRASLPPDDQDDPLLVLDVARALRADGRLQDAARFWAGAGVAAEAATPAGARRAFWQERDRLARLLLDAGDVADARAVATDPAVAPGVAEAEQLFLLGWIDLRFAHDPAAAAARFTALARSGSSLITRARAAYWLAETARASGDTAGAARALAEAARFPTTFYGQIARARLRAAGTAAVPPVPATLAAALAADGPPPPAPGEAAAFSRQWLPRAALLLTAWGAGRHARAFLDLADERTTDPETHALAARLALSLGLPDEAVAVARRAGRDGVALPRLGWPVPFRPPASAGVSAALVLAITRQESGFDTDARSPAGALGLMQLLPSTAAELARRQGVPFGPALLTADPSLNLALGTDYLASLLVRAGGNLPLAIAAYNAGPHRAASWPPPPPDADAGAAPDAATVDWIEAIPVAETRNYVERVMENRAIYQAEGADAS